MQDKQSVYDKDGFFELYQKLRSNPNSLNEIVEKPTMLGLVGDVSDKRILDLGCGCRISTALFTGASPHGTFRTVK